MADVGSCRHSLAFLARVRSLPISDNITVATKIVSELPVQIVTSRSGGMSLVDLGKKLLEAAKRGDTDAVRALMSNGAPFTTDWLGTSPLHFAAQYGHLQTAEVLLRAGISRDARTKVDRTPLHVAAQEGHVDIVELLLENSADIDAKDMLKMSPLHWATEKGHIPVVEVLLKHSADTGTENKFDRTPLDIAIANGRTDIAQLLQLAQHTEISCTEGETVTIETTPDVMSTMGMLGAEVKEGAAVLPVAIVPNTATTSKSKKDAEGSDQSSTSVLATLAALAEATAPINAQNVSSSEAMNWLESQGITMISTADGGIITSAVESGQTISLTEAGKIALNLIRQQGLGQAVAHDGEVETGIESVVEDSEDQKVITIVTDQGDAEIPTNNGTVLVAVNPDGTTTEIPVGTQVVEESPVVETEITEPLLKKIKTEDGVGEVILEEVTPETDTLASGDAPLVMAEETTEEVDPSEERLRKQLEEVQKQAQEYKRQLEQKAEEAEGYKKKLSEINQSPEKS